MIYQLNIRQQLERPLGYGHASVYGQKIAAVDEHTIYIATQNGIYHVRVEDYHNEDVYNNISKEECVFLNKYQMKKVYQSPENISWEDVHVQSHGNEINIVATNSHGHAHLLRQDAEELKSTCILQCKNERNIERGWAGGAFHPTDSNEVIVARSLMKDISIFKNNQCVGTVNTMEPILQVDYVKVNGSNTPLVCAVQLHQVSLYDFRQPSATLVKTLTPSMTGALYTMGSCPSKNILAVGGDDRLAYMYDIRKWSVCGTWNSHLKYEMTFLQLMEDETDILCFASSHTDSEISCGRWNSDRLSNKTLNDAHFTTRIDGRLTGFSKMTSSTNIVASTIQDSIFILRDPHEYAHRTSHKHLLLPTDLPVLKSKRIKLTEPSSI